MAKTFTGAYVARYLNSLSKTYANEIVRTVGIKSATDKRLVKSLVTTAVFKAVNDYNEIVGGK